ncbi:MAG: hypothetical protein M9894_25840 [Planctomycetes bacterium]|nr:hypothetical protein [Planctomycetota bacterium]
MEPAAPEVTALRAWTARTLAVAAPVLVAGWTLSTLTVLVFAQSPARALLPAFAFVALVAPLAGAAAALGEWAGRRARRPWIGAGATGLGVTAAFGLACAQAAYVAVVLAAGDADGAVASLQRAAQELAAADPRALVFIALSVASFGGGLAAPLARHVHARLADGPLSLYTRAYEPLVAGLGLVVVAVVYSGVVGGVGRLPGPVSTALTSFGASLLFLGLPTSLLLPLGETLSRRAFGEVRLGPPA